MAVFFNGSHCSGDASSHFICLIVAFLHFAPRGDGYERFDPKVAHLRAWAAAPCMGRPGLRAGALFVQMLVTVSLHGRPECHLQV